MNWILRDYISKICYVYIDDIIIFSDSIEEHHRNVCLILQTIHEARLYLSLKKSNLYADKVEFLGHTVLPEGLEVTTATVNKITKWPVPHNVWDIKAFNGLVNYIAEFIPWLADYSNVLSRLTRKGVEFKWEAQHQKAFETIKTLARNTPVYHPINYESVDPIIVVADTSNKAVGGYYGQG